MAATPVPRPAGIPEEGLKASWRIVDGNYFRTLQVPLLQGRLFAPRDEPHHSMILSRVLASRLWPGGESPVGRQVRLDNGQIYDVVGVVGDVRQLNLREEPTPTVYLSTTWYLWPTMTLVVRTRNETAGLARSIRRTVSRLDPDQPVAEFQTMRNAVSANAAAPRLQAILLASFAGLALLLAVVGVAGVVGYSVGQRTREIAVRLALGSSPGGAVWQVLRGSLLMCVLGILFGIGAALAVGRALLERALRRGRPRPAHLPRHGWSPFRGRRGGLLAARAAGLAGQPEPGAAGGVDAPAPDGLPAARPSYSD